MGLLGSLLGGGGGSGGLLGAIGGGSPTNDGGMMKPPMMPPPQMNMPKPPMNLPQPSPMGGGGLPPPFQGAPANRSPVSPNNMGQIPGGPASSWRPQSTAQLIYQANKMLNMDSFENLQQNNPQFQNIMKNLDTSILKNMPNESKEQVLRSTQDLRRRLGDQLIPTPPQSSASGNSSMPQNNNNLTPPTQPQVPLQKVNQSTSQPAPSGGFLFSKSYAASNPLKFGETNQTSMEKYEKLRPAFQQKLSTVFGELEQMGWKPMLRNGLRSQAQANKNAAAGVGVRNSLHLKGIAADVVDASGPNNLNAIPPKFWKDLRAVAKKHGLRSGMDFRKIDRPHIDMGF